MHDPEYKPTIQIVCNSPEQNVFTILGKAVNAIRKNCVFNAKEKESELRERFTKAHDYEEALRIIGEYVDIIPVGGDIP